MATHPFKPDGSRLPLYLTVGGMITLGIVTTTLGFLMWSAPEHEPDESTEGMVMEAPPAWSGAGAGGRAAGEIGSNDAGPGGSGPSDDGPRDAAPGPVLDPGR